MKQFLKKLFLPEGRQVRRVRGGLAKGMLMELDLHSQSQRYWGLDEREIMTEMKKLSLGCKSLIDVGANDGYYTMAFLKSSAERVVACEPGPSADVLRRNAAANGYELDQRFSIVSKPIGIGSEYLTITKLVEGLPQPILLKVDIEGGESDLLASSADCPSLSEMRWLIETHSPELETRCIDWLRSHAYQARIIDNARWRLLLPELRPLRHNRWLIASPIQSARAV